MRVIAQGAEALIIQKQASIIKRRVAKGYRYPLLDAKLRKLRTRQEARLLEKANLLISVPLVSQVNEKTSEIEMQYLKGKKLADILDTTKNAPDICRQIGTSLATLHDKEIMHGDLTTSNMILVKEKVYFIDFGLGFHSSKIEDRAVDLHLLKEALKARHPTKSKKFFEYVLQGYKQSKDYKKTLLQLDKVAHRGRYKAQY